MSATREANSKAIPSQGARVKQNVRCELRDAGQKAVLLRVIEAGLRGDLPAADSRRGDVGLMTNLDLALESTPIVALVARISASRIEMGRDEALAQLQNGMITNSYGG